MSKVIAESPIPLGIVVARASSRRLPGKNMLRYKGLPLFVWAARSMQDSRMIQEVVVSTDDVSVASLAEEQGLRVILRGPRAARYAANVVDAVVDVLETYDIGECDAVACVYGTAFRLTGRTVQAACTRFRQTGAPSLMGVSRPAFNPYQVLSVADDGLATPVFPAIVRVPPNLSDDLRVSNGTIYIAGTSNLRAERSFYVPGLRTIDVPENEVTDINTAEDARHHGLIP